MFDLYDGDGSLVTLSFAVLKNKFIKNAIPVEQLFAMQKSYVS